MLLEVLWDLGDHLGLCHLLDQVCQAICLVKVLETWSWRGKKRGLGLKQREVGEGGGEGTLTGIEEGGGRRTGELLMIGIGEIGETLEGGEMVEVEDGIIGERGSGRKMMGGEGKEGGMREGEVKIQEGVETGAEIEGGEMTGMLLLEVVIHSNNEDGFVKRFLNPL